MIIFFKSLICFSITGLPVIFLYRYRYIVYLRLIICLHFMIITNYLITPWPCFLLSTAELIFLIYLSKDWFPMSSEYPLCHLFLMGKNVLNKVQLVVMLLVFTLAGIIFSSPSVNTSVGLAKKFL